MSTIARPRLTFKTWLSHINIFKSEEEYEDVEFNDEQRKALESADSTMSKSNMPIKTETKKSSKKGGFSESIAQDKTPNIKEIKIPQKMQDTYDKIHEDR